MDTRLVGTAGFCTAGTAARIVSRKLTTQESQLSLHNGEVMHLGKLRHGMLLAVRGTVWVTQDGDIRDVILESGDTMSLDRGADVLVSAMSDATVTLR